MEVLIIGFVSALLVTLSFFCGIYSLHNRVNHLEQKLLEKDSTRILKPEEVKQWKSTVVTYPNGVTII